MPDYYPIVEVNPEWMLDPESMGSKQKFWYRDPGDTSSSDWLFKYPRPDSGEHWAEKIAAEVAQLLEIPHGRVELAVCGDTRGSVTESFTGSHWEMFHGNQLLELRVGNYNPDRRRPSQHTLVNIWQTLISFDRSKLRFAEYLILDAIIGNTDRHHENWGVLIADTGWERELAPSFDHASSLGRDISDEVRDRRLREGSVGAYVERGRGGIYWSEDDRWGPSPLELVRRAVVEYPNFFRPGLAKLAWLHERNILEIMGRVPVGWMTDSQRSFATAIMLYNLEQLSELN